MIHAHYMQHPGGSESWMYRALGAPLWEPTRLRALGRAVAWHLRRMRNR